jgi:tetratricopeptide (TPR) repeat protein
LLAYSSLGESARISQIILEVPDAQPFLLRAEAELDGDYTECLADANMALEIDRRSAAAHGMRARVYRQAGDLHAALQAAEAAVALAPEEAEWRLILAKVLVQVSDFARARKQLQEVLTDENADELAKANAHLLMGDVLALSLGDGYAAAIKEHQTALGLAKPLLEDPRIRRRRKASEIAVDAQLHIAYSVGWGKFQHKPTAVAKWLDGAANLAEGLVEQEILGPEVLVRVNEQALAALAGLTEPPDATKWENAAVERAEALIDVTSDRMRADQIRWQLGLALCDGVQIEQARGNADRAIQLGQLAFDHLKRADTAGRQLPNHDYLLGQLFYRMGAIHAIEREDHEQAVVWYGQAVKLLESPVPLSHHSNPGRHGETFVSIAVSYWQTGDRMESMRLTKQGVKLMEQAVEDGVMEKSALAIPYANLASMYTDLGDQQRAAEFATLATKFK